MTTLAVAGDAFRRVTESSQASLSLDEAPCRAGEVLTLAEVDCRSFIPTGRTVRAVVVSVAHTRSGFCVVVRAVSASVPTSTGAP